MIGLDKGYIIDVEYGRRNVAIDNIEKMALGLDIPISELFDFSDEDEKK